MLLTNVDNYIKHQGIICGIDAQGVHVRIEQSAACEGCKIASNCNASSRNIKIIDIVPDDISAYAVGDHVMVSAPTEVAMQAMLWAFGAPFIILVSALFITLYFSHDEAFSALLALALLLPYYIGLFFMRGKMKQKISFVIEKQ